MPVSLSLMACYNSSQGRNCIWGIKYNLFMKMAVFACQAAEKAKTKYAAHYKEEGQMMRKVLLTVTAILLALLLLAGCGEGNSVSESKTGEAAPPQAETETGIQQDSQPASQAQEEQNTPSEPAGPAELNKVIYDANGIRITAISAESRMTELEKVREEGSVFNLSLHIERTGSEKNALSIYRANANGFKSYGDWSFLIGIDESNAYPISENPFMPFLKDSDETDAVFCLTKEYAEKLELKSIGEIGFVLEIIKEDGSHCFESVKADLGAEAEPRCGVSFGESGRCGSEVYVEVSNSTESVMLVECLLHAYDTAGNPLYIEQYSFLTGEEFRSDGFYGNFYIRDGADSLPVSRSTYWFVDQNGDPVDENDIGSITIDYLGAAPVSQEDLTDVLSYEMEGRLYDSPNLMIFRCTWPDEYPRLRVCGTCFVYTEDGTLYKIIPIDTNLLKDDDYREWSSAVNKETGAWDFIDIDCEKEAAGGEYRFDLFLYYTVVDNH